jgi:hypothetical protein
MPLFGHREPVETTPDVPPKEEAVVEREPSRRGTLFGRRRSVESTSTTNTTTSTSPRRGLLTRDREDASITAARQRVAGAEAAESEADRALLQARAAVNEAREHVKRLEREAAEEQVAVFPIQNLAIIMS